MSRKIPLTAVGHASSIFILITFIVCVLFDLLFPEHAMFSLWIKLLPGFTWLSWKGFFIGAVESYAYGWYFALLWVPLYNFYAQKAQ